jgi:fatty acid desaturase
MTPDEPDAERRRQAVASIDAILFVIAIVGLFAAPGYYVIWVFLLVFALATAARGLVDRWRNRRAQRG